MTIHARDVQGPALNGYFADPALVRLADRYWIFPTTDGTREWEATSFSAFSSADLETWVDHGEIFSVREQTVWATGHAWAPTMVERAGRYYLYFSADWNIGVAVADAPTGPFRDLGRPLVAKGSFEGVAIDPSIFQDTDGTYYLLWGNGVGHIVPLRADMMSFDPSAVRSMTPGGFREAVWMHYHDGCYYLSWSENDTRDPSYRVGYATGPGVYGPWKRRGILIESDPERGVLGTGHHSILRTEGGSWVVAYHRFARPGGDGYRREVVLALLHHESDGLLAPVRHEPPGAAVGRPAGSGPSVS